MYKKCEICGANLDVSETCDCRIIKNDKQIVYVDIKVLHPHPDNPRKELGDLTELADSIRSKGVLQNLTVVPWFSEITRAPCDDPTQQREAGYRILIGHRRCEAAKLAGLTALPCVIIDMPPREQVATMLLENMQRSDLSVYEEAQGFQLMLNLGESVGSITEKTGFSSSTVRRRIKLLDLDQKKFQKAQERGTSLFDYMELDKVKDIDAKNKLLDTLGTVNFQNELKKAVEKEKTEENRRLILELLSSFATQIEDSDGYNFSFSKSYSTRDTRKYEKPADAGEVEYFFCETPWGAINLYTKTNLEEKEAEEIAKEEARIRKQEKENQLSDIATRAFELRFDFIKNLSGIKNKMPIITEMLAFSLIQEKGWSNRFKLGMFMKISDLIKSKDEIDDNLELDDVLKIINSPCRDNSERITLALAYANMGDGSRENYHNWRGEHEENEDLDWIYRFLEQLGYEMSDEEIAYQLGTHEIWGADREDEPDEDI